MRKFMKYATVPMSIAALSACADQSAEPTGPQGNLNLSIAPLTLPGITNASYDLWVTASSGTVWSEAGITANTYGDSSGAVTYIGTCDAQAGTHTVHLKLNDLYEDKGSGDVPISILEYNNPCPVDCSLTAPCTENTDTAVTYNLAIMRDADQGFFDIAVNFQDVFCSAKVDCQTALLHNAAGVRSPTAVVGFACTTGSTNTYLHVNYNVGGTGLTEDQNGTDSGGKYAIYRDMEELSGGFAKGFWNAAILLDGASKRITGYATASESATAPSQAAGTFNSYPVIAFDVTVPDNCDGFTVNQLDGANSGVTTTYSSNPDSLVNAAAGGSSKKVDSSF